MNRRRYLAAVGSVTAVTIAGCIGDSNDGDGDGDSSDVENGTIDDDYDVDVEDGSVDGENGGGYEMYAVLDQEVPLAPTADVYEWYRNDSVVVGDARSATAYERLRIAGAHWSPAPEGQEADDPLESRSTDTRIVTYCACPRHLSGNRAAHLQQAGYENVYILRDGIQDWVDRGYPIDGTDV